MTDPSIATSTWSDFQTAALTEDYWTADGSTMVFNAGGTSNGPNLGPYSWPDGAGYMWHAVFPYDGPTYNMTVQGSYTSFSFDNNGGTWNWNIYNGGPDITGTVSAGSDTYWRVYRSGPDMVLEHSPDGNTWDQTTRVVTAITWNESDSYYANLASVGNSTWYDAKGFVYSSTPPPTDPPPGLPQEQPSAVWVSGLNAGTAPITVENIYNFHFPAWNVVVGSNRVGPQYELNNVKSRTLTVRLGEEATSSFTINGETTDQNGKRLANPQAEIVHELIDDVWWYRNGELLHRGRVLTSNDSASATYDVSFTTSDYQALLARRQLHTLPLHTAGAAFIPTWHPNDIIRWLIDHAENQVGMRLGLTYGQWVDLPTLGQMWAGASESHATIQVADGDGIMDAIKTVCNSMEPTPLEFWIAPDLTVNLAQPRGVDNNIILDYEGVISTFNRTFDSNTYANVIRAKGSSDAGAFAAPTYYEEPGTNMGVPLNPTHLGSVLDSDLSGGFPPAPFSDDPRGGWQDDRTNDYIFNQAALDTFAKNEFLKSSVMTYSYNCTFGPGQWRGPDHVWVGDHVWFVAQRGRINVREKMRVVGLTITIDDNDVETVQVDLNLSRDYDMALKRFRDIVRNIQKKKK